MTGMDSLFGGLFLVFKDFILTAVIFAQKEVIFQETVLLFCQGTLHRGEVLSGLSFPSSSSTASWWLWRGAWPTSSR